MLGVSGDVPELEGDIGPYKGVSSKVAADANFFGVSELLAIIGQPSNIERTRLDAPRRHDETRQQSRRSRQCGHYPIREPHLLFGKCSYTPGTAQTARYGRVDPKR